MRTVTAQAQDGGGSLLPDWLADAPPWVQVLALAAALAAVVAVAYSAAIAPALADRIRGRARTRQETGDSTEAPEGSATTRTSAPAPPEERYDAKMAVIERLLAGVEKDQEHDRAEMGQLRSKIAQLEADVRARDATIAELRRTIDQLLGRPQQGPTTPPWTQPRPDRSSGS